MTDEQRITHPWIKLAEAASNEKDPQKRVQLINELDKALASHGIARSGIRKRA